MPTRRTLDGMMTMNRAGESDRGPDRAALQWQRVVARDKRADGLFVFAVSSTGIYCRPSCASRRPHRDRVVFFDTPDAAERAGYRACRRCHPADVATPDPWIDRVRRACVYLANVDGHVSLARLASRLGGSPYHFQRSFKRIVGVSPREYADACRLEKMKRGLRKGARVTDAMLDAGYGSSSRFYERAASKLAMTPASYRRGGAGAVISHTIVDSPLGRLLVAATPRGVCGISMGSSDAELVRALKAEYPAATLQDADRGLEKWARQIVGHLEGRRPRLELPLDLQGTAVQWPSRSPVTASSAPAATWPGTGGPVAQESASGG